MPSQATINQQLSNGLPSTPKMALKNLALLLLFLTTSALVPRAAHAQADVAQQTQPQANLDEIIVTARRRDERLMDVPSSIVPIDEQTIANANLRQIDDLRMLAPNLNINTRATDSPNVTLRGVGAFGVVAGVGFYVNDVQQFFESSALPFEDLAQIQVLRGPQGTLYGGSNIGGAIKYSTKLPTQTLSGLFDVEVGDQATRNLTGVISGPLLPEVLSARLTVYNNQSDGYIYNTTINRTIGEKQKTGGRLTLDYDVGDTQALLYLAASRDYWGTFIPFYAATNDQTYARTNSYDYNPPNFVDTHNYSVTLQVDHKFNDLTVTSLSSGSYAKRKLVADLDFSAIPLFFVDEGQEFKTVSEELRIASRSDSAFSWLAGTFFQHRTDPDVFLFHVVPAGLVVPSNVSHPSFIYAGFGNATYKIGAWTLEAGLRVEHDDNRIKVEAAGQAIPGASQPTTSVLPRTSVTYSATEHLNAYAAVTAGHTPGGLTFVNNPVYKVEHYTRETSMNYETGVKGSAFDGRVRFDADIFYLSYNNRLFQTNKVFPGVGFVAVTNNIGSSENYGFEFSADSRVTKDLTLSGGFGLTKAKWGQATVNNPDTSDHAPINLNGLTVPFAPAYQGTVGVDWSHPLAHQLAIGLRADASFVGQQFWTLDTTRRQRPYQLVNLSTRVNFGDWELSSHVSNLFDEKYNNEFYAAAGVGAFTDIAAIGPPRLWTINLKTSF